MGVSKLYLRCREVEQRAVLLELLHQLLDNDPTTMVLSSALVALSELNSQVQQGNVSVNVDWQCQWQCQWQW